MDEKENTQVTGRPMNYPYGDGRWITVDIKFDENGRLRLVMGKPRLNLQATAAAMAEAQERREYYDSRRRIRKEK